MSCNGCRVLRKGCSESCILRPCLQWIESAEAQANATVFVAKFFGRAGLMSFISAVANDQRPALFQSLLYEACGRTVNPVSGAVGLLWTGNWHVCQEAVETVLRGCTLRPLTELPLPDLDQASEAPVRAKVFKRECDDVEKLQSCDLDLCLSSGMSCEPAAKRPDTPSVESEGSVTTTFMSGGEPMLAAGGSGGDRKLLCLFV